MGTPKDAPHHKSKGNEGSLYTMDPAPTPTNTIHGTGQLDRFSNRTKLALPFILIFAVIGGYLIFRSFAASAAVSVFSATTVPTTASANDGTAVELGMKFRSDVTGTVTGVRFYKSLGNTGTHVGSLWSATGTKLGTVTFTNETASGWQQASFASPISIQANTVYVISYHSSTGHYAEQDNGFTAQVDASPLHALADGASGPNGVYTYSSTSSFPTNGYKASNYYVDVLFVPTPPADTTPPTVRIVSPANNTTVSGTVTITGTASDNVGVSSVKLSIDGGTAQVLTGTTSWSDSLDTTKLTNAVHKLTVSATDAAGNTGLATLSLTVNNPVPTPTPSTSLRVDTQVVTHQTSAATSISSPVFTTTQPRELLLAFIASDGSSTSGATSFSSVTGGGLTWNLRERTNTQAGDAEIWQAVASTVLSNVVFKASRTSGSYVASMVVTSFAGADTGTNGAVATANAGSGAPTISLTTTRAGSWLWGVGNDFDKTIARTVGPSQTKVDEDLAPVGDTYWVQSQTTPTTAASGTRVTLNDTAPTTDRWNLAAIEILPATMTPVSPPPDTIPPTTPTNLVATATSATQIMLTWTASTDNVAVQNYQVFRNGTLVSQPTTPSYSDTGLSPATLYTYTVKAIDAAGNLSGTSSPTTATTQASPDTTPPSVPTGLTATTSSATQVNLAWNASTDNTGGSGLKQYIVLRGGVVIATPTTTSYSDTSVVANTSYTYQIEAQDNAGNTSAASTSVTVKTPTVPDTTPPSVPTGLAATVVSASQINLSWNPSTDAGGSGLAGYNVYRNGTKLNSSLVTTTSYGDGTVAAASTYSYTVSAVDGAGNQSAQAASVSASTPSATGPTTASSVTQYGITWTFDKAYPVGQFANGDYWVVGPIQLTAIAPVGATGRNGWEVNPTHTNQEPYDNRTWNLASLYNPALQPTLPATIGANSSIVNTISEDPTNTSCPRGTLNGVASSNLSCIQTAAVLTVLGSVPPNNGATVFRPPYFGTSKPLYSTTSLRTDLLPSLVPPTGVTVPTLAQVQSRFQEVQMDHIQNDIANDYMHPMGSMPNYGANIAADTGADALRLMLNDPISAKMPALINYIQNGIDLYAMQLGGMTWFSDGGIFSGRKLPLTFAAVMLNDPAMKSAVTNAPYDTYQEDGDVYYSPKANNGQGIVLWGEPCSETQYYQPNSGDRDCRDPYGYIDGGRAANEDLSTNNFGSSYQACCTSQPFKGASLAIRLMPSLAAVWNDSYFSQYVDRWVNFGVWASPDPCSTQEPSPLTGTCVAGAGRYPTYQGAFKNGGYYGNAFTDAMWSAYRSTLGPYTGP